MALAACLLFDARAERAVRALGYEVLRVRHYGEVGRVELGAPELERAARDASAVAAIEAAVRGAGYARAELSERPFRSGSLNAAR